MRSVLFVENDALVARVVAEAMGVVGIRPRLVTDAKSALCQLDWRRFDAVVIDYDLPGMSGLELVRCVTLLYPGMPVVLTSAYGATHFEVPPDVVLLRKPYRFEDVICAIESETRLIAMRGHSSLDPSVHVRRDRLE